MLILCDFDGTATSGDVTNLLWDHFGIADWRRSLMPPYRAGAVSILDLMDQGWRAIRTPADELLAFAHSRISLRNGFLELVEMCETRKWPLHVVSNGLDWYLRAFLPPAVPFTSYVSALEDGWRVRLPGDAGITAKGDFKVHVMRRLQAEHPGHETVFIGDGRNDLPVARECGRVFAIRGSTLARLCREGGVPFEEFETFAAVVNALTRPA